MVLLEKANGLNGNGIIMRPLEFMWWFPLGFYCLFVLAGFIFECKNEWKIFGLHQRNSLAKKKNPFKFTHLRISKM